MGNKGVTYDLVTVGGALTYGGTLTLNLNGGASAGTQYDLFDFRSETGSFASVTVTDGTNTYANSFDYTTGVLTITAVPEPST